MVAPLDVHILGLNQGIHDNVRPGAPVKNIAHNVQPVHHQPLDQLADGLDHIGSLADLHRGVDDVFVLILPEASLPRQMYQFVDDLLIIRRHQGANLLPGVFGRHIPAQLHQPVDGQPIPFVQIVALIGHQGQFGSGIINQGRQVVAILLGHAIGKQFFQLFLDFTGGGVEDVQKRLMLAMNVRHKMFRPLGQVQNGLQTDDFRTRLLHRGKLLGKQAQIMQLLWGKGTLCVHNLILSFLCFSSMRCIIAKDFPNNKSLTVKTRKNPGSDSGAGTQTVEKPLRGFPTGFCSLPRA